jgi:hypothetical protein
MKLLLSLFCICLSFGLSAQLLPEPESVKTSCFTVGYHQGAGSLIGVDFESVIVNQWSAQIGTGFYGFGGGLNYHLTNIFRSSYYNYIRSSFVGIHYWRQGADDSYLQLSELDKGFRDSHTQTLIGPNFVYRGRKWFTAQIGLGYILDKGPRYVGKADQKFVPMYSIGVYYPL